MVMGVVFRFTGTQQKTTSDYLMGNRHMSVAPVAVSFAVSFFSGNTILGHSAEIYLHGITLVFGYIGSMIGLLMVIKLLVPVYHPLKLTSVNQLVSKPE